MARIKQRSKKVGALMPAFCARQLGQSIEVILYTHSRWLDGAQSHMEMVGLDTALKGDLPQTSPKNPEI
ncbi:hypothetical protein A5892_09865 [Halotalea alkalilenta]|uniref:Uncharacterized protein n=1 Tax=Halotalea alkalilenta TaxID=376489 RepID=A0A172YEN2_9GAMM|nr:hypothetical protein A5892_09865 [Halotalea alkalilenta]